MSELQECPDPGTCLNEVRGVLGGVGIAGEVIDIIKNSVELFCNGEFNKSEILDEAAGEIIPKVQEKLPGLSDGVKNCLNDKKWGNRIGEWRNNILKCAGGIRGMKQTIVALLAPYYDDGIISTLCEKNGVSGLGACVPLHEPACLGPLAPWTTGECIVRAGFTEGKVFKPYFQIPFPLPSGPLVFTINEDMKQDVYAICYGLDLIYNIQRDPIVSCEGTIEWELRINQLEGLDGLLDRGTERFKSNAEANEKAKAIATKVKTKAKEILRKAVPIVYAELNTAYQNQLKFLNSLKDAVKADVTDVIGPIMSAILQSVKTRCGSVLPCIDEAITYWNSQGAGANTDKCFNDLLQTTIPFQENVRPIGQHHMCLVPGSDNQWPIPGGEDSQGMPMPPTKGNPVWENYVRLHTQNQDGLPQCQTAKIIDWAWDGKCINVKYNFDPSAAWAWNTPQAQALCAKGHVETLNKAVLNVVAALNATRGPCGFSPLYGTLFKLVPLLGQNQFIGWQNCEYVTPGPGIVDNPDRGGDWPPAGQPGAIGVGVPLPDDCKYYPSAPPTEERWKLGYGLLVLSKILKRIRPQLNWGNTEAEIEAIIKRIEAEIDKTCS